MSVQKEIVISIPEDILETVQRRLENTKFDSLSDYITFILREIVADDIKSYSTEDKKELKKRLSDLGYLG